MSKESDSRVPDYFNVARPAHFKIRTDLIEELCVPEEMMRLLPRNEEARQHWLGISGQPAVKFPLAELQKFYGRAYEPTARYILRGVVLKGNNYPINVLRDGRGWAIACEGQGLFAFVTRRAIECSVRLGLDRITARACFIPTCDQTPAAVRRNAPWAIGFDQGVCTILSSELGDTEELFLAGRSGYYVPFLDENKDNDPSF